MERMERREERSYRRKPLYEWSWPYWLATVGVLGLLLAVFLASAVRLAGETSGFFRILGYTLGLAGFPCGCVLFWWWYRALHEEEQTVITVDPVLPKAEEAEADRPPIFVYPRGRPQLEAPSVYDPAILVILIRELWNQDRLSRREVMRVRLPSGGNVSRSMWERLIGGYVDEHGRERPGLLAAAGLVVRTSSGWAWREGINLGDVLACFDWGSPQIEAPAGSNARADMEALWGDVDD